ncbi:MAG: CotH kinase family protein [Limisphaerales bacterium]
MKSIALLGRSLCLAWLICGFVDVESQAEEVVFTADELFDGSRLLEVEIRLDEEDWEELCGQGGRDFFALLGGGGGASDRFTQFKADITIDGKTIREVGIRKKGFLGSLDSECPSLKVKFDEYVEQEPVKGLDRLTLNNNKQDVSLASQYLTYALFNRAGVPAPRVSFARVTVNGKYLGVYSNVESVREPFLAEHFGDGTGEFYEGTLADFYPKALDGMEAKNKRTEKDRARAETLAGLLESEASFDLGQVEKVVNLQQFMRFWVVESLLGIWDGYTANQNNYFAYASPTDGGRFHFMPWGADSSFTGGRGPFGGWGNAGPKSIYGQSLLANRLYASPGIPDRYKQVMESVLAEVWNEKELLAELHRIEALTKDHWHERQSGTGDGVQQVARFIEGRRAEIENELDGWPVALGVEARKPRYLVEVGKVSGRFESSWHAERVGDAKQVGVAELAMVLEGGVVEFASLGVSGQPEQVFPGFGGPRGGGGRGGPFGGPPRDPRPTLTFQGLRKSDGHLFEMTLVFEPEDFASRGKKKVKFTGSLNFTDPDQAEGGFGFMAFANRKELQGELRLAEASMEDGAPVAGTLEFSILEAHGGFMPGPGGRRGPRGGAGFGGPGGPGGGPERRGGGGGFEGGRRDSGPGGPPRR